MNSLPGTLVPLSTIVFATMIGCARKPESSGGGTVTGTVAYRERMALPPDAVMQVQLSDVSRQDAPATVLADTTIEPAGRQVPIPFELRYDSSAIDPKHSYAVRATIQSGGRVLYSTTSHAPVITRGNPSQVNLMLVPAKGAGGASAELWGTAWRLSDLAGALPLKDAEATLEFPERGKVVGKGSCNRFFGTANVSGDSLRLSQMGSTQMACVGPRMEQERKYLKALGSAHRFSIEGDTLFIYTGSDRPLRFTRVKP